MQITPMELKEILLQCQKKNSGDSEGVDWYSFLEESLEKKEIKLSFAEKNLHKLSRIQKYNLFIDDVFFDIYHKEIRNTGTRVSIGVLDENLVNEILSECFIINLARLDDKELLGKKESGEDENEPQPFVDAYDLLNTLLETHHHYTFFIEDFAFFFHAEGADFLPPNNYEGVSSDDAKKLWADMYEYRKILCKEDFVNFCKEFELKYDYAKPKAITKIDCFFLANHFACISAPIVAAFLQLFALGSWNQAWSALDFVIPALEVSAPLLGVICIAPSVFAALMHAANAWSAKEKQERASEAKKSAVQGAMCAAVAIVAFGIISSGWGAIAIAAAWVLLAIYSIYLEKDKHQKVAKKVKSFFWKDDTLNGYKSAYGMRWKPY